MLPESLAKLDFEKRQEATRLEEYIAEHLGEAAVAIIALRDYCFLLERGLSSHEARATIWE